MNTQQSNNHFTPDELLMINHCTQWDDMANIAVMRLPARVMQRILKALIDRQHTELAIDG